MFWAWAVLAPLAVASTEEEAEQRRLLQEMQRLAERNAWEGVERTFQRLEAVGAAPPTDGLVLGAQAACQRGEVACCRERLARAVALAPVPEHARWLAQLDGSFATVQITGAAAGDALTMQPLPLDPTARAALAFAQQQLGERGAFDGMLAAGAYRVGERALVVDVDAGPVVLDLRPPEPAPAAAIRGRLGAGAAALGVGADRTGSLQQPPGFSALGVRLAGGVEGAVGALLWGAELGYLGAQTDGFSALHLLTGSPTVGLHRGRLRALAGPVFSVGSLRAEGVSDLAAVNAACPYGVDSGDGCAWIADVPEADRPQYRWAGLIAGPGAQASLGLHLFPVGDQMEGRLVAAGGILSDPTRAYPWGLVGVELAPAW